MGVRLKCTEQGFGVNKMWKCVQSEHLMQKNWKTVLKKCGCEKSTELWIRCGEEVDREYKAMAQFCVEETTCKKSRCGTMYEFCN